MRSNSCRGHPRAFGGVIFVSPLPDVVQQQRQHQQLRRFELAEQPREAFALGTRRIDQTFEVPDRQQRVLVDGVLVIEVADHAAVDRLEFGNHLTEQTRIVHLGEPRVETRLGLEEVQQRVAMGGGRQEIFGREPAGVLLEHDSASSETAQSLSMAA